MIVVDASVLVTALGDDGPDGQRARARLHGEHLHAPELVDLEVASVLRRHCAAGNMSAARAAQALADLDALRLTRIPHRPLLQRCWQLRHNVTVYDAAYIALAESLAAPLLTADQRMIGSPGANCTFELLR